MNRYKLASTTAAMLVAGATAAWADPITITSDLRRTAVLAHTADANGRDRHATTSEMNDALSTTVSASTGTSSGVSTASILSSLADPLHLSGTGAASVAYAGQDFVDFSASAGYAVDFAATSAFEYAFGGTFGPSSTTTGLSQFAFVGSRGQWRATLFRFFGGGTIFTDSGVDTAGTRNFSGTLGPGQYRLLVDVGSLGSFLQQGATGRADANFDFALDLRPIDAEPGQPSPTPEPASLLLLATGAVGVFRLYAARA